MSNKNDDMKKKIATGILIGTSITGIASSAVLAANTSTTIDNEVANTVSESVSTSRSSRSGFRSRKNNSDAAKPSKRIIPTKTKLTSYVHRPGPNGAGYNQKFTHRGFQNFYYRTVNSHNYGYITDYDSSSFTVYTGPFELSGKMYLADENGDIQIGLQKMQDGLYYFGDKKDNAYARKGWQRINNKSYFFQDDGRATVGFADIDGFLFFFNDNGERVEGFHTDLKGNLYYSEGNGHTVDGWYTVDKHTYFFDPQEGGAARKSDWYKDDKGRAYLGKDGVMVKGIQEIEGEKYLFTSKRDKQVFYQDFGFFNDTSTGDRYYFDEHDDGKAYKGWFVDGNKGEIYFDKKTGAMAKEGVIDVDGKKFLVKVGKDRKTTYKSYGLHTDPKTKATYYFDKKLEGRAVTNDSREIGGFKYDFGSDGTLKSVSGIKSAKK